VSHHPELRLGTRGSQLALWQAHAVATAIEKNGGPACRIVTIKTSGDRLQQAPLSEAGGKRLFVKEIEDALQKGDIDLAVHSSKDMPVALPDGLAIAAVLPREDPLLSELPRRRHQRRRSRYASRRILGDRHGECPARRSAHPPAAQRAIHVNSR